MTEPGERRPASVAFPAPRPAASGWARLRPRSLPMAILEAVAVGLLAALAWALLRGVLELSLGLLLVAALGGWGIGALLGQVRPLPILAGGLAALAWLAGLALTWLVAMAFLPDSSRTFLERLGGTPFLGWLSPQFGLLEVAGLVLFVVAAAYGARPRPGSGSTL